MSTMNQEKKKTSDLELILKNGSDEQFFILEKWSRIVGKVLSNIEIAISEGRQYTILKRLLNDIMYGARNNLLLALTTDMDNGAARIKIREETDLMLQAINNKIEMSFPQNNQQRAIKASVNSAVEEILIEVLAYFTDPSS